MFHSRVYCSICFVLIITKITLAANILFLPIAIGKSVLKSDLPYALKLAEKGHNITLFTSSPDSLQIEVGGTGAITQIDKPVTDKGSGVNSETTEVINLWEFGLDTPWMFYMVFVHELGPAALLTLENHHQILAQLAKQDWDCVVLDPSYQYYGFVLADLIDAPRVNFISTFYETDHKRAMRLPNSEPFVNVAWFDINSFWDRLQSFFLWQLCDTIVDYALDMDYADRLNAYLPEWIDRVTEYEKATFWISLRSNNFDWSTPQSHDSLLLGGLNCENSPLAPRMVQSKDEELNKFLSQRNKKGIIIASFGHYLSWKEAPAYIVTAFKESFKRFPEYLFVWQYDGPVFDPPIPNIYASPWIPQKQLLAHPKAALFISHMGLKSVQEGTCFGLPFLAFPIFLDQNVNSHIVTKKWKAGLIENRFSITPESMTEKLVEILTNPKYADASRRMSSIQQDVIREPTDLAAFWIEYTMRHDSVMKPYFSSNAKNLNFFAFYLLDIQTALLCTITAVIYSMRKAARICFSK